MQATRTSQICLVIVLLCLQVCKVQSTGEHNTDSSSVWIDSVMLRHILRWKANNGSLYIADWKEVYGNEWKSVKNCTNISSASCDVSKALQESTLTYNVRLRTSIHVIQTLTFCPEFDTQLLAPEYTAVRKGGGIFVRPTTPYNLGTGKPLREELMTVVYQIKFWPKESESDYNISEASLAHTEAHFKVADQRHAYCVTLRLYDKQSSHNKTSGQSAWGRVQCLEGKEKPTQGFSHLVAIAVVLSTLLLVSLTVFASYRIWKIRRKFKNRDKTFFLKLDKIFATDVDIETRDFEMTTITDDQIKYNTTSHNTTQMLTNISSPLMPDRPAGTEGYRGNTPEEERYERERRAHLEHIANLRRYRVESRGYHSASSQYTANCSSQYISFDESEYLPAELLFTESGNANQFPGNFARRSSFSGFCDTTENESSDFGQRHSRIPKYVTSEGVGFSDMSSSIRYSVSEESFGNGRERFGVFPGLNPTYSSDNNRSIPDLVFEGKVLF